MTRFKPSSRPLRRALAAFGVAVLLGSAGTMTPVTAGDLCIAMADSGGQVAGIQLDLKWDSACMNADAGAGSSARCTAEPSTGKDIRTNIKPGPTLKAIFFSMADTSPIPDGNLFCCKFTRSTTAGNACCNLTMGGVLGSDSSGKAIQASDFTLLATMDGQPCAASEAGSGGSGQPRAPVRSGLQGAAPGAAPPVVSVPGGAPPAAAPPAPAGQPALPGGRPGVPAAPAAPAGMDQVQRALEQLAPREAPTEVVTPSAQAATTPQTTRAAGTPTAKGKATEVRGTPTPAAKKTPSAATTPGAKTPGGTPEATPKPEKKAGGS